MSYKKTPEFSFLRMADVTRLAPAMSVDGDMGPIFCLECGADDVEERRAPHVYALRRGNIEVVDDWHVRCGACGAISHPGPMLDASFRAVADVIRRDQGLLGVAALKQIRSRLHLTQVEMEQLLGCGEKTWVRWERGKVTQSKAQDALIRRLAEDPAYLLQRLDETGIEAAKARDVALVIQIAAAHAASADLAAAGDAVPPELILSAARAYAAHLKKASAGLAE
jgi:putative zinc finger/helix-turn-helix YgiT family protein